VPTPTLWWIMPHFSHCWTPSLLQAYRGKWRHTCLLWLAWLFTVHVEECTSPPPVELSTGQPLLQAFPAPRLLGGGRHSCLLCLGCLSVVHVRECLSLLSGAQGAPPSLLCVLFFNCLFIIQFFFFFPWAGVSLSRGLCCFVPGSTVCHLFAHLAVSQAV
jgi:hypothetical protein